MTVPGSSHIKITNPEHSVDRFRQDDNWNHLYLESLILGSIGPGYTHHQATPSDVWTAVHNFGTDILAYRCEDDIAVEIRPKGTRIVDENTLELTFDFPVSGKCHIVMGSGWVTPGMAEVGTPIDCDWLAGGAYIEDTDTIATAICKVNRALALLATPPSPITGPLTTLPALTLGVHRFSGWLSDGAGQNFFNMTPGNYSDWIIPATFQLIPSLNQFDHADQGTLEAWVNGAQADIFDLDSAFVESERITGQTYPPADGVNSYIHITAVQMQTLPNFQKGTFIVDCALGGSLRTGENYDLYLKHSGAYGGDQTSDTMDLFYDDGPAPYIVAPPSMSEGLLVSSKFLDGIRYYSLGDKIQTSFHMKEAFNRTYLRYQAALIEFPACDPTYVALDDPTATKDGVLPVPIPPNITDDMYVTNKAVEIVTTDIGDVDASLTITPRNPVHLSESPVSAVHPGAYLVWTWGIDSTDTYEPFVDNNRRMPAEVYDTIPVAVVGQWDDTIPLVDGSAQVYDDTLIYPVTDFTVLSAFSPAQQPGTNYSLFSGDQEYYRAILPSSPKSSGTLVLPGYILSDLQTGNVRVHIKLPTQTGWMDLGTYFNAGTFTGADDDGILTTYTAPSTYQFTFGSFSTSSSGNLAMVRITLMSSLAPPLESLTVVGW